MKLHFEPNLDYQLQAIEAVCDLFRGQEVCRTEFTVTMSAADGAFLPGMETDLGVGNRLTLLDDDRFELVFDDPQFAVAVGQSAVLYDGERLLGGGVIEERSAMPVAA